MPKNKGINLLPQEEFNVSTTGRVLKWATSTFRIIVIATEMVVMGAFLSRFWLDAQNSNLNNSIKVKSAQISAQKDLEQKFRSVQSKLNIFGKLQKNQNISTFLNKVTSVVPKNITLTRISIEGKVINVHGISTSDYDIGQFVANLKKDPFKNVDLKQVSSSDSIPGATEFILEITY